MRLGLHALGIGVGARPEIIRAVAAEAERSVFARLWVGEHVVMVDSPGSRYPYSEDGRIAVPAIADWLDPMLTLTYAAAATSRIELATGVLLLPEHNPVVTAKRAATLDVLSGGRFTMGIGIGWLAEEFAALGVPFIGRGRRTREYVDAMRVLWRDDISSFAGEYVQFDSIRVYPKPVTRHIPIIMGGNSEAALVRAAKYCDGWYGFNVPVADMAQKVSTLVSQCHAHGRSPTQFTVAVAPADATPNDLPELARCGVTELVVVAEPPDQAAAVPAWIADLAAQWS